MSTPNFNPVGEFILVQPTKKEKETESGIILSSQPERELPSSGVVIAISEAPCTFGVGDTVYFSKYSGASLSLDGTEYNVLKVSEIYGYSK